MKREDLKKLKANQRSDRFDHGSPSEWRHCIESEVRYTEK